MQQLRGSVINSMILGRNHFCCLCFRTVADSAIHIEDKVIVMKDDKTYDEVFMIDILKHILGPEEISDQLTIFNAICNKCSAQAVNSYKFNTMCKDNSLKLGKIIDSLTNGTDTIMFNAKDSKAGFVSINTENFEYKAYNSRRTSSTSLNAYQRFLSIQSKDEAKKQTDMQMVTIKPEPNYPTLIKPESDYPTLIKPESDYPTLIKPEPDYPTLIVKLFLRPRLIRLNPKILKQQTVFVCPICDQFYLKRHFMHLHLRRKHIFERRKTECVSLINSEPVIKTNENHASLLATTSHHQSLPVLKSKPEANQGFGNAFKMYLDENKHNLPRKVPIILKHSRKIRR